MENYKIMLFTISPPENDCGCRVVLYRHLEERKAFDYFLVTRDKWVVKRKPNLALRLPYILHRIEKSRFGPLAGKWLRDYENLVWPYTRKKELEKAVEEFKPQAVLTLADPSLSPIACRIARKYKLPLIGMFNDWFPMMPPHYGHLWTCNILSRRYRDLYKKCDLAFCTSEGMQKELGPHPNSHVLYPIPGTHKNQNAVWPEKNNRFRIVYVGSAEGFYGRMLCNLINAIDGHEEYEFKVITPKNDWPRCIYERAKASGCYLGFMPPAEATKVMAGADALLVVMSFEKERELFVRTSFTTKLLDYSAMGKPIIVWGPDYCTAALFVKNHGGACLVQNSDPTQVLLMCDVLKNNTELRNRVSEQALVLSKTLFSPDQIQKLFEYQISKVIAK